MGTLPKTGCMQNQQVSKSAQYSDLAATEARNYFEAPAARLKLRPDTRYEFKTRILEND